MQNRINRLENLVLSLMNNGPQAPGMAEAQAALGQARSKSMGSISANNSMDTDGESMMRDGEGDDSDVNDVSQRIGFMKVADGKAWYASDAHWYTILADVGSFHTC